MIEHGVSALVLSPTYGDEGGTFDAIARGGIPTMQVLRKVDPRVEQFPSPPPIIGWGVSWLPGISSPFRPAASPLSADLRTEPSRASA